MTPERFALVKQLFEELCELPPERQATHLRELTDDAEIASYVEKLLKQTQSDHPRVSRPIAEAMSELAGSQINVGDTLGVWKLVAEIGQGGMGRVFRAARSDGQFEQDAAVKVLQGLPSARALEYLARERQILASLIHPNIARLYDGGATPGGQPYLVMEYVDGVAIDRYISLHHAPVSARLKLMRDVCDALSFAHQRLIVHCDIKPSNILATKSGRPMLLDFGIARLLDGEPVNEPGVATPAETSGKHTLARAFTPQYASPEQQKGEVLTTATDVYSLGSLLNELLAIPDRTERTPKLDVELRAIVAKAAHPDVAQRYATAVALSADIERYLAKQPLQAMPRTAGYVSRKFVERFWPWLGAATIVVATVAMATQRVVVERDRARAAEQEAIRERDATRLAQAETARERDRAAGAEQVAAQQRDRAQSAESSAVADRDRARASETKAVAERNRASQAEAASKQAEIVSKQAEAASKQTSEFLVSIFDSSNPNAESGDIPASKLIAAAETRLEKEMRGQPATQAELYSALGRVQDGMGANAKARANYERAIAIERGQNRPLTLSQMLLRYSIALQEPDSKTALLMTREALALREQHTPPGSAAIGEALAQLGSQLSEFGQRPEGEAFLKRGLAILEAADPRSPQTAVAQYSLALHSERMRDFPSAESAYQKALAIYVPRDGEGHPNVLRIDERMAVVYLQTGRRAEAEAKLRHVLAATEKLHGRENEKVARLLFQLGNIVLNSRPQDALPLYEDAEALFGRTSGKANPSYAVAMYSAGVANNFLGDYEAAAAKFSDSQALFRKSNIPSTSDVMANSTRNLGRALTSLKRYDEAERQLLEAYDLSRKNRGEKSNETAESLIALATWAIESGKSDEAAARMTQLEAQLPLRSAVNTAQVARLRAQLAESQGRRGDALKGYETAEQMMAKAAGENTIIAWTIRIHRAQLLKKQGTPEERLAAVALAQDIRKNVAARLPVRSMVLAQLKSLIDD